MTGTAAGPVSDPAPGGVAFSRAAGPIARVFTGRFVHAPTIDRLEVLGDAFVGVDADGAIVALGRADDPTHAATIDAACVAGTLVRADAERFFLPGLVDLHVHAPQWPQLGKALHLPLREWPDEATFPLERRYADLDFAERVYRSLVSTLLSHGTTTAVYFATLHDASTRLLADLCVELGQRALVGRVCMDHPDECPADYRDASVDAALAGTEALISHLSRSGKGDGRVLPAITPRFVPSCTDALPRGLGELAHCNLASDADLSLMARRGAGVAHCPLSNCYFSDGVFRPHRADIRHTRARPRHRPEAAMPGPPLAPFTPDAALPCRVDTVVIGAGIAGLCTALELVERGQSVAVCEKGEVAAEQSSRNWGWVRVALRDPREIELVLESQRSWSALDRRIGADVGYRVEGIAFAAHDAAELASQERWLEHARPYQVRARMLGPSGFAERFPGMALHGRAALVCDDDGRAEPQLAGPAIARACRAKGAHVHTRCAVRGLQTSAGSVSGVVTERGTIACDSVVLAGGAWSSLFCASLGLRLPQLKLLSVAMRTAPMEGGPATALWTDRYAVRRREDGGYTVATGHRNVADIVPDSFRYFREFRPALRAEWSALSLRVGRQSLAELAMPRRWALDAESPFERVRTLDPTPRHDFTRGALDALRLDCPAFEAARVEQTWAGLIDVTPDAIPVLSAVDELPGFHVATGLSGHGFGIGPGAGRLMADIVTGAPPVVDPAAFRWSRFQDDSPIVMDAVGL